MHGETRPAAAPPARPPPASDGREGPSPAPPHPPSRPGSSQDAQANVGHALFRCVVGILVTLRFVVICRTKFVHSKGRDLVLPYAAAFECHRAGSRGPGPAPRPPHAALRGPGMSQAGAASLPRAPQQPRHLAAEARIQEPQLGLRLRGRSKEPHSRLLGARPASAALRCSCGE